MARSLPQNRRVGRAVWMCAAAMIALATLTPSSQPATLDGLCLVCGELGGVDVLLNVLLFLPLGVGLAMSGKRAWPAVAAMCAASTCIELLQLTVIAGRDPSMGDVITNSTGGALGFLIGRHVDVFWRPSARQATVLLTLWLVAWGAGAAAASYSQVPAPTRSQYYGQIARALGGQPAYSGRVLSARIGGTTIPDRELRESERLASAFRNGSGRMDVVVIPPRIAPGAHRAIVRIADADAMEIVQVGADGDDLLFGLRTAASAFRLRPAHYRLRGAFHQRGDAGTSVTDTIYLSARYGAAVITLGASGSGRASQGVISLRPGSAWRAIAPASIDEDGSAEDRLEDGIWILLCLLPAGYWCFIAMRTSVTQGRAQIAAAVVLAICLGLAIGPALFGRAAPTSWEYGGAIAGLLVGAAAASVALRLTATRDGVALPV